MDGAARIADARTLVVMTERTSKRAWGVGRGVCLAVMLGACSGESANATDAATVTSDGEVVVADAASQGSPDAAVLACEEGPERTGDGTFYAGDGSGACSFASRADGLFAAMNAPDYAVAAVCGTCAEVTGPLGTVTVPIVDLCPECASGDLDLSPTAFARIAVPEDGRVTITWREVPCAVGDTMTVHVDEGANGYYLAVNLREHRYRIATVERRDGGGTWRSLTRTDYNVWLENPPSDAPIESAHLRITDVHGGAVEVDVAVQPGLDVAAPQLPSCGG